MILVIPLLLFLLLCGVIEAKDDEQMDAFFKYARTSGACIENYLTLMNKHMSAEERAHWEEISLLDIKDFEKFLEDFTFDHVNNSVMLENLKMKRGMTDFKDNDYEMRFKFYIYDGFRYSFTPNGRVLPQNMAKIAFMINWQKLRLTDIDKWNWKFIDYHVITENFSKLSNKIGNMLGKDEKKDVYLCDLLKIALSPPTINNKETDNSKVHVQEGTSKRKVKEGTSKQLFLNVREDFRTMFENLNEKKEITKLRSLVSRWEHLNRYKYWNKICSTPMPENEKLVFKEALKKFAINFILQKGQFQKYNEMRKIFIDNDNEHEWEIVKSVIYPALEFYIHRQQKFDASDLSEIPVLISLCLRQMKNKKKKLNLDELESELSGDRFLSKITFKQKKDKENEGFLKEMLGKWKPSWLDSPSVVGKQNSQLRYLNPHFDVNRLKGSIFMPIEEMDHTHVSHIFDIQKENNWKNWATSENVLHSFEDPNLVESFLKIYPNMYKKSKNGNSIVTKMNMNYFISLKGKGSSQLEDRYNVLAGKKIELPKNYAAWLKQCLEAYLLLMGKESVNELDDTEQINFLFQTNLRIFHRLQNEAKQQQPQQQQQQSSQPYYQQQQASHQQQHYPPQASHQQPTYSAYPPPPPPNPAYPHPSQAYLPLSTYPYPPQKQAQQIHGYPDPLQQPFYGYIDSRQPTYVYPPPSQQPTYGYPPPPQKPPNVYPPPPQQPPNVYPPPPQQPPHHGYHDQQQQRPYRSPDRQQQAQEGNQLVGVLNKLGRHLMKALVLNERNKIRKEKKIKNCGEVSKEISNLQHSPYIRKEQMEEILAWTKENMNTILSHRTSDLSFVNQRQECIEKLNVFQILWQFDIQHKYETNFAQDLLNLFVPERDNHYSGRYYNSKNFDFCLGKQIKALQNDLKNDKNSRHEMKKIMGKIDTKLWMHAEGQFEILIANIAETSNVAKYNIGSAYYELKEVYIVQLSIHILLAAIYALNRQMREALWADTIDGTSEFQQIKFKWEEEQHLFERNGKIKLIHGLEMHSKMVEKMKILGSVLNDIVQQHKHGQWDQKKIDGLRKQPFNAGNLQIRGSVQALAVNVEQMATQKEKLNQIFAEMSWKSANEKRKTNQAGKVTKLFNNLAHRPGARKKKHGKRKGKEEKEEEEEGEEEKENSSSEGEEEQGEEGENEDSIWDQQEGGEEAANIELPDEFSTDFDFGDFGLSSFDFAGIDLSILSLEDFDLSNAFSGDWIETLGGLVGELFMGILEGIL